MSRNEHKNLGCQFGELAIDSGIPGPESHPDIIYIHSDAMMTRTFGKDWHSDISCDAEPPIGTTLHLMTVLKRGDDTLFLSIYAAHDTLSDPIKSFLDGLLAHNSGENVYRGRYEHRGVDDTELPIPIVIIR